MLRRISMIVAILAFGTNASADPSPNPSPSPSELPVVLPTPAPTSFIEPTTLPTSAPSDMPAPSPSPSPSPAPSPEPMPSPEPTHPDRIDGAYSLPGGIWTCETLANSSATSIYKLVGSREIVEKTTLQLPNRPPVELDTLFTYHPHEDQWTLSMQHGAYLARAATWSGEVWTFIGIEADAIPHKAVRLVYTSLGPDAYRSDYQAQNQSGRWETFSGATCKRSQP